jgi:hypothetical protein
MSRSDATGPYVKSVALLQELEAAGSDEWRAAFIGASYHLMSRSSLRVSPIKA